MHKKTAAGCETPVVFFRGVLIERAKCPTIRKYISYRHKQ